MGNQSCAEFLAMMALENIKLSIQKMEQERRITGEDVVQLFGKEFLGHELALFQPAHNGYDRVFRDGDKIIVAEVKTTHGDPLKLLGNTKKYGPEMGEEWVIGRASDMTGKGSSFAGENNCNVPLGQEILAKFKQDKSLIVRRLYHFDPDTYGLDVYEDKGDGDWVRIMSYSGKDYVEKLGGKLE